MPLHIKWLRCVRCFSHAWAHISYHPTTHQVEKIAESCGMPHKGLTLEVEVMSDSRPPGSMNVRLRLLWIAKSHARLFPLWLLPLHYSLYTATFL